MLEADNVAFEARSLNHGLSEPAGGIFFESLIAATKFSQWPSCDSKEGALILKSPSRIEFLMFSLPVISAEPLIGCGIAAVTRCNSGTVAARSTVAGARPRS